MQRIDLFERDVAATVQTKFSDIDNDKLITVARQLHSLEKNLPAFKSHKDFVKLENSIHNAKIDLATEMRKRGIPLATLFQSLSESMRGYMNLL